ncbi:GNAT family N-acetyltransferase [Terrabacter sp. BE26]|uniref:GNAT family N-acetyltransferase n=1 Tax=Terrabacter sp. BE26 TaxID=2898152 RepID=UPI0035BE56A1
MVKICAGGLDDERVQQLLAEHIADMYATSPAESVHALDLDALRGPGLVFWTAWDGPLAVGCGALKDLNDDDVELKSMRTSATSRGKGVGTVMLRHLLDEARRRGAKRVLLETGSQQFFAPARRLYERHQFTQRGPFAGYVEDPNSHFYELAL